MKGIILRLFCLACMLCMSTNGRCQLPFDALNRLSESQAYRDFHIIVTSGPDSYCGSVRVVPEHNYASREHDITLCTDPAPTAELKANLTARGSEDFTCLLFAYPRAGYALDGFVLKKDYQPGQHMEACYLKDHPGRKLCSGQVFRLGKPSEGDRKRDDPTFANDYRFMPQSTVEIVAVFREAVAKTVSVTQPGTLAETIERQEATETDNLTVNGPLNADDLMCLKDMSLRHRLVRLNLSGSQIEVIPENAFRGCPLYEVALPSQGLKRVATGAFDECRGLASCPIPEGVKVESNVFHYSIHLPMKLDNDNGSIGHFDELVPVPLAERTDLVSVADVMPAFPGGEQAMLDYISQNMRYPELAREMGIQGTVIVRFAVEKDGRISTPEVVKSVDRTLDREALRLVGQMPKWSPGSVGGTPTGVIMMLPIRFK